MTMCAQWTHPIALGLFSFGLLACGPRQVTPPPRPGPSPPTMQRIERVAFGSCSHQNKRQPILHTVRSKAPDVFVYLGDNIYGDTEDMDELRSKYAQLGAKTEFQALRECCTVHATWDDHDYGANDAGKHYAQKEASQEIFLDFWQVPADSARRQRAGVYGSHIWGPAGQRVQLILLDTRFFRDDLLPANDPQRHRNDYRPNPDPEVTLLGEAQWSWLRTELQRTAEVRLIATSTQFGIEYNGYEAWANFPTEQERLIDLIRTTGANGVVFISGDVHYGELSVLTPDGLYPLYDVTSSGITQTWPHVEANANRVGEAEKSNNFGLIEIDWKAKPVTLSLGVYTLDGAASISHEVPLNALRLPPTP